MDRAQQKNCINPSTSRRSRPSVICGGPLSVRTSGGRSTAKAIGSCAPKSSCKGLLSMPLSKHMKRLALALMLLPTTTQAYDCVSKAGDEPEGRKVTLKNMCATGAFVKITCDNGQRSSLYIQPCRTAWFSVGAACGDPHVGWQFENPTSDALCRR